MKKRISLSNIEKSYKQGFSKQKVISNLSFEVFEGEVFGFIGPNGAGKSTIINLIMGFINKDSGEITLGDLDVRNPENRSKIGYLPEDPRFYDHLTARELLIFAGKSSGLSREETLDKSEALLGRLKISHAADKRLRIFSKGMKQRIGLAMAMIHDPDIYILDEPMSGLDPIGRSLLKSIIIDLKERGKTVFFSSHILNDVETLCDRIGVINKGKMLFCGEIEEFKGGMDNLENVFIDLIMKNGGESLKNG